MNADTPIKLSEIQEIQAKNLRVQDEQEDARAIALLRTAIVNSTSFPIKIHCVPVDRVVKLLPRVVENPDQYIVKMEEGDRFVQLVLNEKEAECDPNPARVCPIFLREEKKMKGDVTGESRSSVF